MSDFLCMKCRGAGTRAHHRRCPKRGDGHRGRRLEAERLEMRGLERAIDVRVRRGKRGVGVSIDKALAKLLRHVALPSMGAEVEIRAMAAELLGCGATVEAPEFGHVVVRPVRERPESVLYTTWRKLSDHMPIHIALTVEQAHG